jgi:predicted HAD superfamily Cof-like phosphohydrolase
MKSYELVKEFHETFGVPVGKEPHLISRDEFEIRRRLIEEELKEFYEAYEEGDYVHCAQELADLRYVVDGTIITFGFNPDAITEEVHRSNMTKLEPCPSCNLDDPVLECTICQGKGRYVLKREDGKVLKGSLYELPNIEKAIKESKL